MMLYVSLDSHITTSNSQTHFRLCPKMWKWLWYRTNIIAIAELLHLQLKTFIRCTQASELPVVNWLHAEHRHICLANSLLVTTSLSLESEQKQACVSFRKRSFLCLAVHQVRLEKSWEMFSFLRQLLVSSVLCNFSNMLSSVVFQVCCRLAQSPSPSLLASWEKQSHGMTRLHKDRQQEAVADHLSLQRWFLTCFCVTFFVWNLYLQVSYMSRGTLAWVHLLYLSIY